jgi:hypothetical protein
MKYSQNHMEGIMNILEKTIQIYYIPGCTECQPTYPSQHPKSLPKETKEIRYHKLQNLAKNIKRPL